MAYEIRRDERLADGLRRNCQRQVDLALAFARGEKETEDSPVHETRKHLKKARAVLHLVRKEIGRELYKRQDHCLRDVGRLISEVRDAEVRLDTVRQLQGLNGRGGQRKYRKLEEMLCLELENFVVAFAEWHVQAIPMLEAVREKFEAWPVDDYDNAQLCDVIQGSYKIARRALAVAKVKRTSECFHEFRTATKRLGSQLRLIRPVNPVVLGSLEAELKALGDLLGRAHDLSFLGQRLQSEHGKKIGKETHEILAVIEASVSDLQRGAADLAERFFAQRPRDFGSRIADWLEKWSECKNRSLAEELVSEVSQAAAPA